MKRDCDCPTRYADQNTLNQATADMSKAVLYPSIENTCII